MNIVHREEHVQSFDENGDAINTNGDVINAVGQVDVVIAYHTRVRPTCFDVELNFDAIHHFFSLEGKVKIWAAPNFLGL